MASLEPVPSIRRIETDRPDVFAIEIAGFVTAADVENIYGLLEGAYALHDRIDLLVRIVGYQGAEWDQISQQTIADGKARAMERIVRCAAVGEPDWLPEVQGWFTTVPVELKHFDAGQEGEAWAWIGAKPVEEG